MRLVHYEDENTRYIDIGPVNKVINMLCCYFEDPTGLAFKKHLPRLQGEWEGCGWVGCGWGVC